MTYEEAVARLKKRAHEADVLLQRRLDVIDQETLVKIQDLHKQIYNLPEEPQ